MQKFLTWLFTGTTVPLEPLSRKKPAKTAAVICSFCREPKRPLVEGPDDVFICRECSEICIRILQEESERREAAGIREAR